MLRGAGCGCGEFDTAADGFVSGGVESEQLKLLQQHGGDMSFSDAGISASDEEHERELPHVVEEGV
jgi:hypothetical protein